MTRRLACLVLLVGCGTIFNHNPVRLPLHAGTVGSNAPFGGLRVDGWLLRACASSPALWALLPLVLVDLPLTLVGDVLTLPFSRRREPPAPARPTRSATSDPRLWRTLDGPPGARAAPVDPWQGVAATASGSWRLVAVQGRPDRPRDHRGRPAVLAAEVGRDGVALVGRRDTLWLEAPAQPGVVLGTVDAGSALEAVARLDSSRCLVVSSDVAFVVDGAEGVRRWRPLDVLSGPVARLGPDRLVAASGSRVEVMTSRRHAARRRLAPQPSPVTALAVLDPRGSQTVVVGRADGVLGAWTLTAPTDGDREPLRSTGQVAGPVVALAPAPDGATVAVAAADGVWAHAPATGTSWRVLERRPIEAPVIVLAWDAPGVLLAGRNDGLVLALDPLTGAELDRLDLAPLDDAPAALRLTLDGGLVVVTRCGLVLRYARG